MYDDDLLAASAQLLRRRAGQRGRLPGARVRRSVSTTYYAMFHFLLDEAGRRVVGSSSVVRERRRLLGRMISHTGAKAALDKVRGVRVHDTVSAFMRSGGGTEPVPAPTFLRNFANAFSDAYAKRQDADYNLSEAFSEEDARLLRLRVRRVIRGWRAANGRADQDAKKAICLLILLKGQLRGER